MKSKGDMFAMGTLSTFISTALNSTTQARKMAESFEKAGDTSISCGECLRAIEAGLANALFQVVAASADGVVGETMDEVKQLQSSANLADGGSKAIN